MRRYVKRVEGLEECPGCGIRLDDPGAVLIEGLDYVSDHNYVLLGHINRHTGALVADDPEIDLDQHSMTFVGCGVWACRYNLKDHRL